MSTKTTTPLSIFIIDKCYFDRYFLGRQLGLIYSYSIIKEFSSGKDALYFLDSLEHVSVNDKPHVAIVDVNILLETGLAFIQQLNEQVSKGPHRRNIKIFATGPAPHLARFRANKLTEHLDGLIPKPAEIDTLEAVVTMHKC